MRSHGFGHIGLSRLLQDRSTQRDVGEAALLIVYTYRTHVSYNNAKEPL
jgi:integrase